jgi:hypothetical protein
MFKHVPMLAVSLLFLCACSDVGGSAETREFNLSLRYGILARNQLNTFQNTITKDLVLDGTVTVPFVLAASNLDSIEARMQQIGFFGYPDTVAVRSADNITATVDPACIYEFSVFSHGRWKALYWLNGIVTADSQAVKLRDLIAFIQEIVESTPEYKQLPPARGAYL